MARINIVNRRASLKAFNVDPTEQDACIDTPGTNYTLTLYHDGSGTFPDIGDYVYTNEEGTSFLSTTDHAMSDGMWLRVNNNGISITIDCP